MKKKFAPGQIFIELTNSGRKIHLSGMESSCHRIFMMMCSRLLQFVVLMTIIALGAAIETPCGDESDCPPHQFCYDTSNICVNYTNCSTYNRDEGATNAQHPSQCGKCVQGYASETLATGDEEPICKRMDQVSVNPPVMNDSSQWWIYMASGVACLSIIGLGVFFLRKRLSDGDEKWFRAMGTWKFTPTAPPQENAYHLQQPFYTDEEPPIYSSVIGNNNNNNNVKERLVNAMPTIPPSWVQIDPSYDEEDGAGNTSGSTAISTTIEVEDEETTPSSWTPENVTVQVPARPFHQFAPEQRDNVLNAVLVRGDCGSNSTPSQESTPEPAPEGREGARAGGNTYRGPNVQINQMITLNMVKSDN